MLLTPRCPTSRRDSSGRLCRRQRSVQIGSQSRRADRSEPAPVLDRPKGTAGPRPSTSQPRCAASVDAGRSGRYPAAHNEEVCANGVVSVSELSARVQQGERCDGEQDSSNGSGNTDAPRRLLERAYSNAAGTESSLSGTANGASRLTIAIQLGLSKPVDISPRVEVHSSLWIVPSQTLDSRRGVDGLVGFGTEAACCRM